MGASTASVPFGRRVWCKFTIDKWIKEHSGTPDAPDDPWYRQL
jgi:hypothetical protein